MCEMYSSRCFAVRERGTFQPENNVKLETGLSLTPDNACAAGREEEAVL